MNKFQDMKKLLKLRKEAKQAQKKLKKIHVEAEEGNVLITITGEQEVIETKLDLPDLDEKTKKKLQDNLTKAFNKGIKKSQEVAAENMKGIMDQLGGGFPGLGQ